MPVPLQLKEYFASGSGKQFLFQGKASLFQRSTDTAIAKDITDTEDAVQRVATEVEELVITSATVDMSNVTMSFNLKAVSRHVLQYKGSVRKGSDSFKEKRVVDLEQVTALTSGVAQ